MTDRPTSENCAFCGRDPREARRMVAGAAACICDQCITFAAEQITRQDRAEGIIGMTERDLRLATQRLECLRITSLRTSPQDDTVRVVDTARTLMSYVSGSDQPALEAPVEMRIVS